MLQKAEYTILQHMQCTNCNFQSTLCYSPPKLTEDWFITYACPACQKTGTTQETHVSATES